MNRQLNLEQVRQLLSRSASQLDEATLTRLRQARAHALQRHAEQPVHTLALSGQGRHTHASAPAGHRRLLLWMAALLLAVGILSSITYWYQAPANDTSDVDIAILTDDLPLQVYVD